MHFTGRTWRPPYEASSVIIQAASGCTYRKCRFCSLYQNECFRMTPIEEFEEDLKEIKHYQPYARRMFWTGANPFAMSYENLKLRALTVRDYLIKCRTQSCTRWKKRDGLFLPGKRSVCGSFRFLSGICR